jgi:cysteine-rich repeat protein
VEGDEPCDDGNTDETDDCLIGCKAARCGDGKVWAGMEACDDGNEDDTHDCLSDCTLAGCGDGFVWDGKEPCDDGNEDDTDACLTNCTLPSCGDGFVQAGVEDCEDGDLDDLDECNNDCAAPRVVFLTSTSGNLGALGGVVGADAHCQSLAKDAGLQGNYAAWLTDGDKTTEPAQRFKSTEFKGWYILPTKTRVARGWMDLTMPNEAMPMNYLQAAITVTEKEIMVNSANVWTNTKVDGTQASPNGHCDNWTSDFDTDAGQTGLAKPGVLGVTWTAEAPNKCSFGMRLYCFEVAP